MKLSIVIPAHNEAGSIRSTLVQVAEHLDTWGIDYEIVAVDDASDDGTGAVIREVGRANPRIRYHRSHNPPGFGFAVRAGLDVYTGDAAAIVMADGSDSPEDIATYYRVLSEGYDCAFGSRFVRGSRVTDYPGMKLALNRIVNLGIRMLFRHGYNDTTNAFKAYRREAIDTCRPLFSNHFNLTVELPLKAVVRGHSYKIVPISGPTEGPASRSSSSRRWGAGISSSCSTPFWSDTSRRATTTTRAQDRRILRNEKLQIASSRLARERR